MNTTTDHVISAVAACGVGHATRTNISRWLGNPRDIDAAIDAAHQSGAITESYVGRRFIRVAYIVAETGGWGADNAHIDTCDECHEPNQRAGDACRSCGCTVIATFGETL